MHTKEEMIKMVNEAHENTLEITKRTLSILAKLHELKEYLNSK